MLDFFSDIGSAAADFAGSIIDRFVEGFQNFIGMLMYYATIALVWIVSILERLFNVFAGITKVEYDGKADYLLNVFFQSNTISNVYWAMALLGAVLVIMFTIIAVIRKMYDLHDRRQQSLGQIIGGMFKSLLTMLLLTAVLSASLTLTNAVIDRVMFVFDSADSFGQTDEITFTDEQYATMARIYKTIGNYSLNPSCSSRYNLNSCYNELRPDLKYLQEQGVFDVIYVKKDAKGNNVDTWQSVLQELVNANDPEEELKINVYYPVISEKLLHVMEILRTNNQFFPLERYGKEYATTSTVGLDRILFLIGTSGAARNRAYNTSPHMTDGVRGAFYVGESSIYSYSEVNDVFDTSVFGGINYIMIIVMVYFTANSLLRAIFGCITRIFNIVSLYVVAPLTVASMPVDDGAKFKQWVTSMVIQALGIFGTIIPMRLVLLFAPLILSPKLSLFENVLLDFIAKGFLIVGGLKAVDGFGGIVTGILANDAGSAAIRAGNTSNTTGDQAFGLMKQGMKLGGKAAAYTAAGGLAAAGLAVAGVGAGMYYGVRGIGRGIGTLYNRFSSEKSQEKTPEQQRESEQAQKQHEENTAMNTPQSLGPTSIASMGNAPLDTGLTEGIEMQDLSHTSDSTEENGQPPVQSAPQTEQKPVSPIGSPAPAEKTPETAAVKPSGTPAPTQGAPKANKKPPKLPKSSIPGAAHVSAENDPLSPSFKGFSKPAAGTKPAVSSVPVSAFAGVPSGKPANGSAAAASTQPVQKQPVSPPPADLFAPVQPGSQTKPVSDPTPAQKTETKAATPPNPYVKKVKSGSDPLSRMANQKNGKDSGKK